MVKDHNRSDGNRNWLARFGIFSALMLSSFEFFKRTTLIGTGFFGNRGGNVGTIVKGATALSFLSQVAQGQNYNPEDYIVPVGVIEDLNAVGSYLKAVKLGNEAIKYKSSGDYNHADVNYADSNSYYIQGYFKAKEENNKYYEQLCLEGMVRTESEMWRLITTADNNLVLDDLEHFRDKHGEHIKLLGDLVGEENKSYQDSIKNLEKMDHFIKCFIGDRCEDVPETKVRKEDNRPYGEKVFRAKPLEKAER